MKNIKVHLFLYWLVLWIYSIFSYTQTDPNLVLTSWQPYWQFQNYMWSLAGNTQLIAFGYSAIVAVLFLLYSFIVMQLQNKNVLLTFEQVQNLFFARPVANSILIFLFLLPLLASYNALSHDVFNYIFNARMVYVYQANPHLTTALEFPSDLWTRFMHNTHTVAPYGFGWTALSLIPYGLGLGYFSVTWIVFRLFSILSIIVTFVGVYFFADRYSFKIPAERSALLLLHPLLLIEVVSNYHNDLWMMALVIFSFVVLKMKKSFSLRVLLSAALLAFSISIKFATAVLIPVWLFLIFLEFESGKIVTYAHKKFRVPKQIIELFIPYVKNMLSKWVPLISSILLFLPLVLPRAKQFLPWYLLWSLVWLFLVKNKVWTRFILVMSFFAMMRYIPWLWFAGYQDPVSAYQLLITWVPGLLYLVYSVYSQKRPVITKLGIGTW